MSTPSNASPDTTILDEHEHESAHTATSGQSSETDERPKSEDVPGVQNGEDVKPEAQDGEIKQETVPLTPEESVGSPQSSSSSTTRPPNDGRRENGNDEKAVIADTSSRSSDNDSAKITEGMARATLNDSGKGTSQPVGYTPPPSVSGGSGSSGNSQPQKIIKPYETVQFCRRPGYVNPAVVTPVKAYSNHFELKTPVSIDFMLYNVEVNMHDGRQWKQLIKREDVAPIFWKIVKQNSDVFLTETAQISRHHIFPTNYIFNDVNLLYVKGLKQLPGVRGHASYLYTESAGRRDFRYEMTVKLTGPQRASFAKNASLEERQNAMTLLDLVLSARVRCLLHPASWQFTTYKNNIYKIQAMDWTNQRPGNKFSINLGNGICAWAGLHAALKLNLMHRSPLVNVDLTYKFYYKAGNSLLQQCFEYLENTRGQTEFCENEFRHRMMKPMAIRKLVSLLKGLEVISNLPDRGPRPCKVFNIVPQATARNFFFEDHEGRGRTSVEQYFREKYNIRLEYPNLPLVQTHKTKQTFLPFELLFLSDVPVKYKGQPREEQLGYFVRESALPPAQRASMIEEMTGGHDDQEQAGGLVSCDEIMDNWGVELNTRMREVPGKMLRQPQLQFGAGDGTPDVPVMITPDGTWEVTDRRDGYRMALSAPRMTAWMVIAVDPHTLGNLTLAPFEFMMRTLDVFGMTVVSETTPVRTFNWDFQNADELDRREMLEREMAEFIAEVESGTADLKAEEKLDKTAIVYPCALFIFPRKSPDAYRLSKVITEVRAGVYHQGILKKNYDRLSGSLAGCTSAHNMFFKINAKLGGTHYRIPRNGTFKPWCKVVNEEEPTLFVGIDVTHPPSEDQRKFQANRRAAQGGNRRPEGSQNGDDETNNRGNSVASIVANIDIDATQYRMSYRIQKVEQERLVNMTDQIVQRIADFITHTGKKPKHIVIYRDGVSETEFKHTFYEEQKAYNNALARLNMEGPDKPTLTYIVTSKRHHTRFFPAPGAKDLLRSGNFRPGLLIEDDVVSSEYFDFYITAQNGALGTSRPTHYYVLHDDWNPSSGFWQNITFALCHLYCRTNKSVSLPAPVYYAHLAAKRAADWVAGYEHNYFAEDKAKERGGQGEDDTYTWLKEKNSTPKVKGMVFC